jgi:hypothetical protein
MRLGVAPQRGVSRPLLDLRVQGAPCIPLKLWFAPTEVATLLLCVQDQSLVGAQGEIKIIRIQNLFSKLPH